MLYCHLLVSLIFVFYASCLNMSVSIFFVGGGYLHEHCPCNSESSVLIVFANGTSNNQHLQGIGSPNFEQILLVEQQLFRRKHE